MARRISRPVALRITRVVAPWGVSAHGVTLLAWATAGGAVCALAWGTPGGWLLGAGLLQLWYLLDHVDGQLARLRGTASLDGAQLDFLMHHTVNLLVPLGAGAGVFARSAEPWWLVAGLVWGLSLLVIGLAHDARYRAFIARLQRVRGRLEVVGGMGVPEGPTPPMPRRPLRLARWTLRKLAEIHVIMNLVTLAAVAAWLAGDADLWIARALLATLATAAATVAGVTLVRSQRAGQCEAEFTAWYRVPAGHDLLCRDGSWIVAPRKDGDSGDTT
jgi:phosphatidylglycerophosphate synthase